MAKITINKDYFNNLNKGTHTLRVNFVDGYSEGQFEVNDKITFYIMDIPCTATLGMSWYDWFISSLDRTGNAYAIIGPEDNKIIYLNHRSGVFDGTSIEMIAPDKKKEPWTTGNMLWMHKEGNNLPEVFGDIIQDGGRYGLSSNGDDAPV